MLQLILTYFVCSGGFLAFLMAVQQVIKLKRGMANFLRFLHLLINCIMLYGSAFLANKVCVEYPLSASLYFTCSFLLGPTYLFTISSLLGTRTKLQKTNLFHLLPALAVLIGEIIFQAQDTVFKQQIIYTFLNTPLNSPLVILSAAAITSNVLYELLVMKDVVMFWNNQHIKREARIVSIRVVASFLALSVYTAGIFTAVPLLILLGSSVHAGIIVSVFITQEYYPQFFFAIKREIRRNRYERSLLLGLNIELIRNRLDELIKDEQIYRDMELSLQGLAGKLSLTPHQLSQFLNDEMKVNFRSFINGLRVKEAQRLLEHNHVMNVSSICYEVGFNSKSRFYAVFKEITGKAPQEYRDDIASTSKQAAQ